MGVVSVNVFLGHSFSPDVIVGVAKVATARISVNAFCLCSNYSNQSTFRFRCMRALLLVNIFWG